MRVRIIMMFMVVPMRMAMMLMSMPFRRAFLLVAYPHINFRGGDPAAHYLPDFDPRAEPKRLHGFFQQRRRHPGVHQRAEKHVAADAGKALKVRNSHGASHRMERMHES